MPITTLDRHCALIVIDLQHGIVPLPPAQDTKRAVEHSVALIQAFHRADHPVVLVNVAGGAPGRTDVGPSRVEPASDWAELIEALPRRGEDILLTKRNWGAFINTELHSLLQARGITQVVVCGIATSIGVESTARQAFELGYHVVLCRDAMADLDPYNHRHACDKIFPRLGQVCDSAEVIRLLESPTV
ncbi:cysteine hydrolase family protein [Vibrio proteolyticus]